MGIDKANSFPTANPGKFGIGGKNQYLWKHSALAKEPFTKTMREKMLKIIPSKVTEFIESMEKQHEGFFEESMKDLFYKRAAAIREIADFPGATPALLASMITDSDFASGIRAKIEPQA